VQTEAQRAFGVAQDEFDAGIAVSDAALVQDQIAVFKALGGGWQRSATGS
jgi:hypothetical protein